MRDELYFKTYLQTYIMNLIRWSLKMIIKVEEGSKFWVFVYFWFFFPCSVYFITIFRCSNPLRIMLIDVLFFLLFSPWSDELIFFFLYSSVRFLPFDSPLIFLLLISSIYYWPPTLLTGALAPHWTALWWKMWDSFSLELVSLIPKSLR